MSKKCKNCGTKVDDNAKFCRICGTKIESEDNKSLGNDKKQNVFDKAKSFDLNSLGGKDKPKNMIIALIVSFFLSGIGIIYAGNTKKGIICFLGFFFAQWFDPIFGLTIWIYNLYATFIEVNAANNDDNPEYVEKWRTLSNAKKVISIIALFLVLCVIYSAVTPDVSNNDTIANNTDGDSSVDESYDDVKTVNLNESFTFDLENGNPYTYKRNYTSNENEMDETTTVTLSSSYDFQKDGYEITVLQEDDTKYKSIAGELTRNLEESGDVTVFIKDSKGNDVENYTYVLTYKDGGSIKKAKGDSLSSSVDIDPYSDLIKIEITPSKVE